MILSERVGTLHGFTSEFSSLWKTFSIVQLFCRPCQVDVQPPRQVQKVEEDLEEVVSKLRSLHSIQGQVPHIDELVEDQGVDHIESLDHSGCESFGDDVMVRILHQKWNDEDHISSHDDGYVRSICHDLETASEALLDHELYARTIPRLRTLPTHLLRMDVHNSKIQRRHQLTIQQPDDRRRVRFSRILASHALRDQWTLDTIAFMPFALTHLPRPRDESDNNGKLMSVVGLACSADGKERLPLYFVSSDGAQDAIARSYRYSSVSALDLIKHNDDEGEEEEEGEGVTRVDRDCDSSRANKMAKTTLNEYVKNTRCCHRVSHPLIIRLLKQLDLKMHWQNRDVVLLINSSLIPAISYEPRRIQLEPVDALSNPRALPLRNGAIRCFKANYRKLYYSRAMDLSEAGYEHIFDTNLLRAIKMAEAAWKTVSDDTLADCWKLAQYVRSCVGDHSRNSYYVGRRPLLSSLSRSGTLKRI